MFREEESKSTHSDQPVIKYSSDEVIRDDWLPPEFLWQPERIDGTPESFNVLVKEMKGLCLDVHPECITEDENAEKV